MDGTARATEAGTTGIRWRWMRLMYGLNVLGAGVPGLVVLFGPEAWMSAVAQDRLYFGVLGSVWLAIGALSVLGLRNPLRFSAIFAVQVVYKSVWFAAVLAPLAVAGELRFDALPLAIFFALALAVCLVAMPYSYLFGSAGERAGDRA